MRIYAIVYKDKRIKLYLEVVIEVVYYYRTYRAENAII